MNETHFKKKINDLLKETGAFIINLHGHGMQKVGLPDTLILHPKYSFFIEFKIKNNKCSEIQKIQIQAIKKQKFPVVVLRLNDNNIVDIENEDGNSCNYQCRNLDLNKINGWILLNNLSNL